MKEGDKINKELQTHETRMSHKHDHGSVHGQDVIKEQDDSAFILEYSGIGKEHKMAHKDHVQMHSTFSLKTDSYFLIEGITISSIQGIILAIIFTFVITVCFDSLKYVMHVRNYQNKRVQKKKQIWRLIVKVICHMLSVSLAYIMMLCVMTMNVWLMVSVVLGSGIAHLVMRPVLSWKLEERSEHSTELNIEPPEAEAEPLNQPNDRMKIETNEMCLL